MIAYRPRNPDFSDSAADGGRDRRSAPDRVRFLCWRNLEARRHAVDRLVSNATTMGANAIVMMRFDSAEIGGTMSEIVAYGTAVVLEPERN
jgi:hypothetical protein